VENTPWIQYRRWEQREQITVENEGGKFMNEINVIRERRGFTSQSETEWGYKKKLRGL
jgi:hypothetical protein